MTRKAQYPLTLTYINVRKFVGLLAMSLPLVIFLGEKVLFQVDLQPSISAFYYTEMRWFFILTLCCIGFFLLFYQGYDELDKWLARIAGVAAFLTALFPTSPPYQEICMSPLTVIFPVDQPGPLVGTPVCSITETIHLLSAATMFVTVAFFSLFRFTKGESNTKEKRIRNRVYVICGAAIVLAIVVMGLSFLWEAYFSYTVYWGEFIALVAFGISWAVKGEMLWKDANPPTDSTRFNALQSRQVNGYNNGLGVFVLLVAIWFTMVLYSAEVPPFNLFSADNAAESEQVLVEQVEEGGVDTPAPSQAPSGLGFEKAEAQEILVGFLFVLVVIVLYFILNHQVLTWFWPLVRRNFRVDLGMDETGEKETLWTLFSNQVNELGVQPRFSVNPTSDTGVSAPSALVPDNSYLKTFIDILNWIFPGIGYTLRLNKMSSDKLGAGLSLAVVKNDRKETVAETILWASTFHVDREKDVDQGNDLIVYRLLMIPAYFWFADVVDRLDGFMAESRAWEARAYNHLGNSLWHSDLDRGIILFNESISLDPRTWSAYAALGRAWMEKSQDKKLNKDIAIEYLLLANGYLATTIEGFKTEKSLDQVYFGALYNQIVVWKYLYKLGWKQDELPLEKILFHGYRTKREALTALSLIQKFPLFSIIEIRHKDLWPEKEIDLYRVYSEQGLSLIQALCRKLVHECAAVEAKDTGQGNCRGAKWHPLGNWLISFFPTLEFVLQIVEMELNANKGGTLKSWLEPALGQIAILPCFEDPINMDRPLSPFGRGGQHFTRSHYRIQYNAACFYSQIALIDGLTDAQKANFVDLALDHLEMALSAGGGLVEFAKKDSTLDAIRQYSRYKNIVNEESAP